MTISPLNGSDEFYIDASFIDKFLKDNSTSSKNENEPDEFYIDIGFVNKFIKDNPTKCTEDDKLWKCLEYFTPDKSSLLKQSGLDTAPKIDVEIVESALKKFLAGSLEENDLKILLQQRVRTQDESFDQLFYRQVKQYLVCKSSSIFSKKVDKHKAVIKLFLKCGFDPEKSIPQRGGITDTSLRVALDSDHLELIALVLSFRKDKKKPLPALSPQDKSFFEAGEYEKLIAKGFGSLLSTDTFRLYSSCAVSKFRKEIVPHITKRLLQAPPSIHHVIHPMIDFIARETASDPRFAVYVIPKDPSEAGLAGKRQKEIWGDYNEETGDVRLYSHRAISTNIKTFATTLLHEIAHKIVFKLEWNHYSKGKVQRAELAEAVEGDIWAIHCKGCDPAVVEHLDKVEQVYFCPRARLEEYLVRTIEIVSDIADRHPDYTRTEIEVVLMKNIPHLYTFLKNVFLPELETYNRASSILKKKNREVTALGVEGRHSAI